MRPDVLSFLETRAISLQAASRYRGFVGAFLGHFMMGFDLSIISMMGMVALSKASQLQRQIQIGHKELCDDTGWVVLESLSN